MEQNPNTGPNHQSLHLRSEMHLSNLYDTAKTRRHPTCVCQWNRFVFPVLDKTKTITFQSSPRRRAVEALGLESRMRPGKDLASG